MSIKLNVTKREFYNLGLQAKLDIVSKTWRDWVYDYDFSDENNLVVDIGDGVWIPLEFEPEPDSGSDDTHYEYCQSCMADSLFSSETCTCLTCGSW